METSSSRVLVARVVTGSALLIMSLMTACALGPDTGGGIGGTGIIGMGPIQRFGSVFVNGREYFIAEGAPIDAEGRRITERDLHLGDVVVVDGRVDVEDGTSHALRIRVEPPLRGIVESVDPRGGTFTILGQSVHVLPGAFVEDRNGRPTTAATVRAGDPIAASGLVRSDGAWAATRVFHPTAPGDATRFAVRAVLRAVDRTRAAVTVGNRSLSIPPMQLPPDVAIGKVITITGRYAGGRLVAETVRLDRPALGPTGTRIELSGFVRRHPSTGELLSNGIVLRPDSHTSFVGGGGDRIAAGAPVFVSGTVGADGGVAPDHIFVHSDPLRAEPPTPAGASRAPAAGRGGPPVDSPSLDRPAVDRPTVDRPSVDRPPVDRPWIDRPPRPLK